MKKNEIRIIIETEKLDKAYGELDDFVIEWCKRNNVNYYELFGLLESLKLNYNDELSGRVEEGGKG